ncbi:unnamed protein product [Blepharisma stoltei]|uniref:Uncharacterized protein n=1 Tax=Blepharisma stoltei TaxID=1481888 RepID=A0AAU9JTG9_9CILI|nr:unnamed protein product [Blepharisma stoltei]
MQFQNENALYDPQTIKNFNVSSKKTKDWSNTWSQWIFPLQKPEYTPEVLTALNTLDNHLAAFTEALKQPSDDDESFPIEEPSVNPFSQRLVPIPERAYFKRRKSSIGNFEKKHQIHNRRRSDANPIETNEKYRHYLTPEIRDFNKDLKMLKNPVLRKYSIGTRSSFDMRATILSREFRTDIVSRDGINLNSKVQLKELKKSKVRRILLSGL